MHANNELGTVQPTRDIEPQSPNKPTSHSIRTRCKSARTRIPIDVQFDPSGCASISSNTLRVTKRHRRSLRPRAESACATAYGGHHQRGFRHGTENVEELPDSAKPSELAAVSLRTTRRAEPRCRDKLQHRSTPMRSPIARDAGAAARHHEPIRRQLPARCSIGAKPSSLRRLKVRALLGPGAPALRRPSNPIARLNALDFHPKRQRQHGSDLAATPLPADIDFALNVIQAAVAQTPRNSTTYQTSRHP